MYLSKFASDTPGQDTIPLPTSEIMDIIYHSMSSTWKNKMIEQGINYTDYKKRIDWCLYKKSTELRAWGKKEKSSLQSEEGPKRRNLIRGKGMIPTEVS